MGPWSASAPSAIACIVLAAAVVAVSLPRTVSAEQPPSLTSSMICECVADPGGGASLQPPLRGTISPSGRAPSEDIHVRVIARDVVGAPLAGASIIVHAASIPGSTFRWDDGRLPAGDTAEDPQAGLSDATGVVDFYYDEGGLAQALTGTHANLSFEGVIETPLLRQQVACPFLTIVSVDLDGSGTVELPDFALFAYALRENAPGGDFNHSGGTDLIDFSLFGAHLNTSVDEQ
jgi:hypothetical protein